MRTPFHFLGRHVFHVLREAPLVAEGIGDLAVAVAPELIFERHVHFRARRHCAIEGRIHIFQIEEDPARILHSRHGRGVHARELVGKENVRVSDLELRMPDFAIGTLHAYGFFGAKHGFVKFHGLGCVLAGQIWRNSVIPLRNCTDGF